MNNCRLCALYLLLLTVLIEIPQQVLFYSGEQVSIGVKGMTVMHSELDFCIALPQVIL